MKQFVLAITALLAFNVTLAQSGDPLKSTSKLVGMWKYQVPAANQMDANKALNSAAPLIEGEPQEYIRLAAGDEPSALAPFNSPKDGLQCPTTFVARTSNNMVSGTIDNSCMEVAKGKTIAFNYRYHEGKDMLYVMMDGVAYGYERVKK